MRLLKPGRCAGACATGEISRLARKIARHRAHDIFRKRRTFPLFTTIDDATEVSSPLIQRHRVDQQLRSALAKLPELHRAALTLRYFEEMDYRTYRKHARPYERRAARNSRPRPSLIAQTTSPGSRFNGLNLWQSFTTKSTTGSLLIFTANSPPTNRAPTTYSSRRLRRIPKNSPGNQNHEQDSGRNPRSATKPIRPSNNEC